MKKLSISLCLASTLATPVFAQSSVVLYGIADVGVNRTSNKEGARLIELRSGNSFTSRFGIRAREDLGGGMGALLNVESGFNVDTGTSSSATQFWNRQAWVGLSMRGVGQITAGVQLPTISDIFVASSSASYFATQGAALDGAGAPPGSAAARYMVAF